MARALLGLLPLLLAAQLAAAELLMVYSIQRHGARWGGVPACRPPPPPRELSAAGGAARCSVGSEGAPATQPHCKPSHDASLTLLAAVAAPQECAAQDRHAQGAAHAPTLHASGGCIRIWCPAPLPLALSARSCIHTHIPEHPPTAALPPPPGVGRRGRAHAAARGAAPGVRRGSGVPRALPQPRRLRCQRHPGGRHVPGCRAAGAGCGQRGWKEADVLRRRRRRAAGRPGVLQLHARFRCGCGCDCG